MTEPLKNAKNDLPKKVARKLGLKGHGSTSFLKLCKKGCEPEQLANYLVFLTSESEFKIRNHKISLRPFDSIEEALSGLTKQDLNSLQKAVLKIAKTIDKVNGARIVSYMESGSFNPEIHKLPPLLIYYAEHFIPLVLGQLKNCGEKQRPDYSKLLIEIIEYVISTTGSPNHRLLAAILTDRGQDYTEESLKQWWDRHKPTRKGNAK